MNEVWRSIKDYEGLYEVSNFGRVRNCLTGLVLKPHKINGGYLQVSLCKDGVRKHCLVHRLVVQAFPDMVGWTEGAKGRPFEELEINHKDKNKENNRVDNLEWCDRPYNVKYSLAKTVYMYNEGGLCGLWPSTAECGRNGFNIGNISACCNRTRNKHKGFKWSYEPPKPLLALPYYP